MKLLRSKVDGFVPRTQHVSLAVLPFGRSAIEECPRGRRASRGPALSRSARLPSGFGTQVKSLSEFPVRELECGVPGFEVEG